jgi:uncharacterized protein with von Willebrand factor type A (vWA) domain
MQRTPVQSSHVAEVGHDAATLTLEIAFKDGKVYQYFDVPETVFQELMSAPSVGIFLNAHIKNNYRYAQL